MMTTEQLRAEWPTVRVSPAEKLDLVVDYDAEGWPVYMTFAKGTIFRLDNLTYKVVGFTLSDNLLVKPHGEGHGWAVCGYEMRPDKNMDPFAYDPS